MATINRIGGSVVSANSITIPSHEAGDLIILSGFNWSGSTISKPAGWETIIDNTPGPNHKHLTAFKFATDDSTVSGTWTNAAKMWAVVYRPDKQGWLSIGGSGAGGGSLGTPSKLRYPAVTLKGTGSTVLYLSARGAGSANVVPTGWSVFAALGDTSAAGSDQSGLSTSPTETVTDLPGNDYGSVHGVEIVYKIKDYLTAETGRILVQEDGKGFLI